MKSFTFWTFTPPSTLGPAVAVAREDIVAVEQHYDPKFDPEQGKRLAWRTLLHLRGGSTLLLSNDWKEVVEAVYGPRLTPGDAAGNTLGHVQAHQAGDGGRD